MTKYHISYDFLNVHREASYNHIFEFSRRLEELLIAEEVPDSSIRFHTEDIKEEEPVFMFYQPTDEEIQREHEHNEFKGFRK